MAEDKKNIIVAYIGQDLQYWNNIRDRFKADYPELKFEFREYTNFDQLGPQKLFREVLKYKTNILYVDFTIGGDNGPDDALRVCKLMRRDNIGKRVATTALHDLRTDESTIARSLMAGVRINHIKSAEVGDVVYNGMNLYRPDLAIDPDHALAKFETKSEFILDLRVAYATNSYFRVETSIPFTENEAIHLTKHSLSNILESNKFIVSNITENDLYYNMRTGLHLDYSYYEIIETPEENEKGEALTADEIMKFEIVEKKKYDQVKANVDAWVNDQFQRVIPKKTKILIIDGRLGIFDSVKQALSKYPYSINVQTTINNPPIQVSRNLPHIIAMVYDPEPKHTEKEEGEETTDENKNEEEEVSDIISYNASIELSLLVEEVKKHTDYEPIIILFNAKHKSETLQEKLEYKKLMSNPNEISIETILHLAKTYEETTEGKKQKALEDELQQLTKRDPKKWAGKKTYDLTEKKVFFKSNDTQTVVQARKEIKIVGMTESQVFFQSETSIPDFTVLKLDFPLEMLITIVPIQEASEFKKFDRCYRGLINCVGESSKAKIRQYINKIFSMKLEAQEKEEREAFENLNKQALEKRSEEEEAARKAAEEEAEKDKTGS